MFYTPWHSRRTFCRIRTWNWVSRCFYIKNSIHIFGTYHPETWEIWKQRNSIEIIRFFRKHFRNVTICIWFLFSSLPSLNHTKLHFVIQTHLISTFFDTFWRQSIKCCLHTNIDNGKVEHIFLKMWLCIIFRISLLFSCLRMIYRWISGLISIKFWFLQTSIQIRWKLFLHTFSQIFFLIQFDGVYSPSFVVYVTFTILSYCCNLFKNTIQTVLSIEVNCLNIEVNWPSKVDWAQSKCSCFQPLLNNVMIFSRKIVEMTELNGVSETPMCCSNVFIVAHREYAMKCRILPYKWLCTNISYEMISQTCYEEMCAFVIPFLLKNVFLEFNDLSSQ